MPVRAQHDLKTLVGRAKEPLLLLVLAQAVRRRQPVQVLVSLALPVVAVPVPVSVGAWALGVAWRLQVRAPQAALTALEAQGPPRPARPAVEE